MKFKIKQLFKMLCQHVIFPFFYFINRWRKIDNNRVVLADAHHDTCPPHMEAIRTMLLKEHFDVVEYFADISRKSKRSRVYFMLHFMKLYSASKVVIICDNFLPVSSCRKRSGTFVIQLWHGCGAFKKFGYDAVDDIPSIYRGNVYRNYDLVTVSGEKCVPYFKSAMHMDDSVVKAIGVSYTDRLYDRLYIDMVKDKFRYEHPDAVGKKVVLWAPTFRGNAGAAASDNAVIPGEDYIDRLRELENIYLIKSLHPHMIKDNIKRMSTGELIVCADLLITDYSSILFEYLIMDRPIVLFAPDYEEYSDNRGYYLDYNELAGCIVTDGERLCKAVMEAVDNDGYDMRKRRREFRETYMSACDGNATGRVIAYIKSGLGIEK